VLAICKIDYYDMEDVMIITEERQEIMEAQLCQTMKQIAIKLDYNPCIKMLNEDSGESVYIPQISGYHHYNSYYRTCLMPMCRIIKAIKDCDSDTCIYVCPQHNSQCPCPLFVLADITLPYTEHAEKCILSITCAACNMRLPIMNSKLPIWHYSHKSLKRMWHSVIYDLAHTQYEASHEPPYPVCFVPLPIRVIMEFLHNDCNMVLVGQFMSLLRNVIFKDNATVISRALYCYLQVDGVRNHLIAVFTLLMENSSITDENREVIETAIAELSAACHVVV
jgi:hypothetical protein